MRPVLLAMAALGLLVLPVEAGARRPVLATVTVDAYVDQGEPVCARFRVPLATVTTYLATMRTAPGRFYTTELYSPCAVTGTLSFTNGESGTYAIKSSGMGLITTDRRGTRTVFAQPRWNDPWAGGYGLGD